MKNLRPVRAGPDEIGPNVPQSCMKARAGLPPISVHLLAVPEIAVGVLHSLFEVLS